MNIDKNKKYIVAVSGGSDSMALISMCIEENINIVCAHVNYRLRENAYKEMEYVNSFCNERNIKCFILNKDYEYKGNFEAFARNYRYDFFKKINDTLGFDGVLIAHNEDDYLETYIMQKEKNIKLLINN